jgi:hypothetical protein
MRECNKTVCVQCEFCTPRVIITSISTLQQSNTSCSTPPKIACASSLSFGNTSAPPFIDMCFGAAKRLPGATSGTKGVDMKPNASDALHSATSSHSSILVISLHEEVSHLACVGSGLSRSASNSVLPRIKDAVSLQAPSKPQWRPKSAERKAACPALEIFDRVQRDNYSCDHISYITQCYVCENTAGMSQYAPTYLELIEQSKVYLWQLACMLVHW